jgi:REP element-mobilizing transposase RayT
LVSLADTPYYHCIERCVRRGFLCGLEPTTGGSFEHRRQWIVDRINWLSSIFAIDICAYAVMSNHYHVVVHVDVAEAELWSAQEVAERWLKLFAGPPIVGDWLSGGTLSIGQRALVDQTIQTWRSRLSDLSWFMRCLNEPIARLANAEDKCTGRFWEGRFKSQALLDERALLACMAYVDLNPIRAAIATTPEASEFTSVRKRIRQPGQHQLMRFSDESSKLKIRNEALPFELSSYLELVDWAGREVRSDKCGAMAAATPPILQRLSMNSEAVVKYLSSKPDLPLRALGPVEQLRAMAASFGLKFLHGMDIGKQICAVRH